MSQVRGRTQHVCYAPSDGEHLRIFDHEDPAGARRLYDPAVDALGDHPKLARATPFVAVLEPGETLLVPRRWWHYSRALGVTVALARTFVNSANEEAFSACMAREREALAAAQPSIGPEGGCVRCHAGGLPEGADPGSFARIKLKQCSACVKVDYCSAKCQKAQWAVHKRVCKALALLKGVGDMAPFAKLPVSKKTPNQLRSDLAYYGAGKGCPMFGQMVRVHYVAYLPDGQKFDSSRDRGAAREFRLGSEGAAEKDVVRGWAEALTTMAVGEKALVAVRAEWAFGTKGLIRKVVPGSDVVYETELVAFW